MFSMSFYADLKLWVPLSYKKLSARACLEKNWAYWERGHLAEDPAALRQSHTKREDFGMLWPKPTAAPAPHRDPCTTGWKHFIPTPWSPCTAQRLLCGKVSKLPPEAATLRQAPFREAHLFKQLCLQCCRTHPCIYCIMSMYLYVLLPMYICPAVFQQQHFSGVAPTLRNAHRKGGGDWCQAASASLQLLLRHLCSPGRCGSKPDVGSQHPCFAAGAWLGEL